MHTLTADSLFTAVLSVSHGDRTEKKRENEKKGKSSEDGGKEKTWRIIPLIRPSN